MSGEGFLFSMCTYSLCMRLTGSVCLEIYYALFITNCLGDNFQYEVSCNGAIFLFLTGLVTLTLTTHVAVQYSVLLFKEEIISIITITTIFIITITTIIVAIIITIITIDIINST